MFKLIFKQCSTLYSYLVHNFVFCNRHKTRIVKLPKNNEVNKTIYNIIVVLKIKCTPCHYVLLPTKYPQQSTSLFVLRNILLHCYAEEKSAVTASTKILTCSRGGHLNSLVFLAATADGKSDCLISMYLLS
jgi:hypothetical protein